MHLLYTLSIAFVFPNALGFAPPSPQSCREYSSLLSSSTDYVQKTIQDAHDGRASSRLLNCGLLISSWSDGVLPNSEARSFLKKGLARSLLSDLQKDAETLVESSVVFSPCCGPDTQALANMESIDKVLERIHRDDGAVDEWIDQLGTTPLPPLKVLYIPTAMYALRADSTNTPGKQRQRARSDGKKRRNQVVDAVESLFHGKVNVLAVTLDFDDGSIKQPEGSESDKDVDFPKDGKRALLDWSPNLIYVEGGNTFWLHHCMTKGGWQDDLVSAITTGNSVYCGKSAGAILAGKTVETATWKGWDDPSVVPGRQTSDDWKEVQGLDLVGGASFFPHMSDEWNELTKKKKQQLDKELYCLRDEDVCLVQGIDGRTQDVSIASATSCTAV